MIATVNITSNFTGQVNELHGVNGAANFNLKPAILVVFRAKTNWNRVQLGPEGLCSI